MKHILLIEDEPVIRGAVTQLLERQGYRVTPAGSIEEADACARKCRRIAELGEDRQRTMDGVVRETYPVPTRSTSETSLCCPTGRSC